MKVEFTVCDNCKADMDTDVLGSKICLSPDDSETGRYEELDFCSRACLIAFATTSAGVG